MSIITETQIRDTKNSISWQSLEPRDPRLQTDIEQSLLWMMELSNWRNDLSTWQRQVEWLHVILKQMTTLLELHELAIDGYSEMCLIRRQHLLEQEPDSDVDIQSDADIEAGLLTVEPSSERQIDSSQQIQHEAIRDRHRHIVACWNKIKREIANLSNRSEFQ